MKYLIPLIVAVVMIQLTSAFAQVERMPTQIQYQAPSEGSYQHGSWCMDSRVF